MSRLGVFRIHGVAEGPVNQPQRRAVHDVQDEIPQYRQETRAQAQAEETGPNQRQEDHQREHPREERKSKSAPNVGSGHARLEKVRVDEGKAESYGEVNGNGRVKDIGGVLNHDVVGQALEPQRICLGAGLRRGLDVREREGNAVRDHGGENHEYGGNKAGEYCSRQPALPQCRLRVQHGRYLLVRRGIAHTLPDLQALRAPSRSACSPTCHRVLDLLPVAATPQQCKQLYLVIPLLIENSKVSTTLRVFLGFFRALQRPGRTARRLSAAACKGIHRRR